MTNLSKAKVPNSVQDLTPAWLSSVLKTSINEDKFVIEENVQSGSGFLSTMTRIHCEEVLEGNPPLHLIVKILPQESMMRDLVISEEFYKTEIGFYSVVMPDILNIVPELSKYLCKCYYGAVDGGTEQESPYASVLILQDLKPERYYTINFGGEETWDQMQQVLQFMSMFHFAAVALEDVKGRTLDKEYNFLQGTDLPTSSMIYSMAKEGFKALDDLLKDCGEVSKDGGSVLSAYKELSIHSDKIIERVQLAGSWMPCLIHGDLWPNNLLFNTDLNLHTKVIDWQLMGYKDATFDVAVTILSSLPKQKLNKENVNNLLEFYYKGYVAACVGKGRLDLVKRNWEEFSDFFYTWALSYTMLWFLMSHDTFSADDEKLVNIYKFLAIDGQVPKFLLSQVNLK